MKKNKKKRILRILIIIIAVIAALIGGFAIFWFCCGSGKTAENAAAVEHAGLYVDGTALKSRDGQEIVLRGVNHAHCWYRDEDETALDAIAATGANCVRIVCACGIQWDADDAESLAAMIQAAYDRGMLAIVEVHDGTGSDDLDTLDKIADFWVSMADVLKGTEAYCIVNIANEWCGSFNAGLWKKGYVSAIPKLRAAGIANVIMVDAAGWGQYGRSVKKYGYEVFESDPDKNTMFSVHMYGMSGRYEWLIRYNLEGGTEQNLCVCVGEFGYTHSDGDVKEDYLMQYCEEQGIGTLAWSWKGNSGGVEYLDLSNDWEGLNLTEWGDKVVNGTYGIKNTSKKLKMSPAG